jgi:hypothetical protein
LRIIVIKWVEEEKILPLREERWKATTDFKGLETWKG